MSLCRHNQRCHPIHLLETSPKETKFQQYCTKLQHISSILTHWTTLKAYTTYILLAENLLQKHFVVLHLFHGVVLPYLVNVDLFCDFVNCVDNSSKFWEPEVMLLSRTWIHLSYLDYGEEVENFVRWIIGWGSCWRVKFLPCSGICLYVDDFF